MGSACGKSVADRRRAACALPGCGQGAEPGVVGLPLLAPLVLLPGAPLLVALPLLVAPPLLEPPALLRQGSGPGGRGGGGYAPDGSGGGPWGSPEGGGRSLTTSPREPGQGLLAPEQLQRLEQRRRDPAPGDRDPDRAEGVAGLETRARRSARPQRLARSTAVSHASSDSSASCAALTTGLAVVGVQQLGRVGLVTGEAASPAKRKPSMSTDSPRVTIRSCTSGVACEQEGPLLLGWARRAAPRRPRGTA